MATGGSYACGTHSKSVKRPFKMVFLGVTGAGKTSLIDLIGNYGRRDSCSIDFMNTFRKQQFEDVSEAMESKTNKCVLYEMSIKGAPIVLIDTPGLQDSRGAEKNEENIGNIISTLKDGEYINCICLVSSGKIPRFDEITQSAVSDILSILPCEVKNNTIIVYTNVASPMDLTISHKKIVQELFPLKGYVLDNAYCGWSKLDKLDQNIDCDLVCPFDMKAEKDKLEKRLQENFKKLDIMFGDIMYMKSISTDCFGDLQRVTEQIKCNYKEIRSLEETKRNMEDLFRSLEDKQKKKTVFNLQLQQYCRVEVIKTHEYNTLCDADECFKNCHAPCIYTGKFSSILSRNVKECRCINRDGICKVCGHHYTSHSHHQFKFDEVQVSLREDLKVKLDQAKTEEERAEALLTEYQFQLKDLNYEEKLKSLNSETAILLAEFGRISSRSSYEKVIDERLTRFAKYVDPILVGLISKRSLMDELQLEKYRAGLIKIQEIPFGDQMNDGDKYTWACKTLDIDPEELITLDLILQAFEVEPRKYGDIIKEGDKALKRRRNHAKKILLQRTAI